MNIAKRVLAICLVLSILVVPAFAVEAPTENNLNSDVMAYTSKQIVESIIQNPNSVTTTDCIMEIKSPEGNTLQLPTRKLESVIGDTYVNTYAVALTDAEFDKITSGSQSNSEWDGILVTAHITIEYKKRTSEGYPDEYLLTKVYGNWDINHQVQLEDQYVWYACYDANGGERIERFPTGTSFSYDTEFTYYARDIVTGVLAARSETTILRGMSSEWTLAVSSTIFNNGMEISPGGRG